MAAKIFRINYKSDFILTLNSDAGWMTPFCIKFWTGVPSQAFFVGWDGETYTHCSYDPSEPTKLVVQFDDHHLPIGELKYQVAYHFTVADFPNDTEDEVINPANITTEIDGQEYHVMLDFTGETAPEIEFSLPAYANEAQRIANEQQRIANEQQRISNEEQRIADEQTRIGNEETRINQEQTRQDNEAQRIRNEQTRINQEEARVREFATLKHDAQEATTAANDAAALANQKAQLAADKAQLAADKAALAQDAANLANQKAQLAADKAALAQDAAELANQKAQLAQQKAEYAQTQGDYAKQQGDYAKEQGDYAKEQGDTALADHQRAEADHGIAVDDHTQAGNDHTRAESDHGIAADDHTQAGNDHTRAESDHGIAADDHTQAGNDHTRAESDHTRAESDHAAVEVYVDSLGAFDISAYHATGGVLAKYADLTAALGTNGANIPDALRKGGMSVKFVLSSDNKYVQYRLMSDIFNTTPANWQGVDDEPTANSDNLIKSGGVYDTIAKNIGDIIDISSIINNPVLYDSVTNWSINNANYQGKWLPVVKGCKYKITPKNANNAVYSLLKSMDTSGAPDYASGTSRTIVANETIIELPQDTNYIWVMTKSSGADVTPDVEVLGHIQESIENVNTEIRDTNLIFEGIDALPLYSGWLDGGSASVVNYQSSKFTIIPIKDRKKLHITTGSSACYIFIAKNYKTSPLPITIELATGETGRRSINANTDTTINLPNDAKYLYLQIVANNGSDMKPAYLSIDGIKIIDVGNPDSLILTDSEVTADSDNLITSGAVYDTVVKEVGMHIDVDGIVNSPILYDDNGSWMTNNASYQGKYFPCVPGKKYEIDIADGASWVMVSFLKTMNTTAPDYATGTSRNSYLSNVIVTAPSDANYMWVVTKYQGTIMIPSVFIVGYADAAIYNLYQNLDEAKTKLSGDISGLIELTSGIDNFTLFSGWLDGGTAKIVNYSVSKFIVIPIDGRKKLRIIANSIKPSLMFIAKNYVTTIPVELELATGETGRRSFPVNSDTTINIPSDAKYVYLQAVYFDGDNGIPAYLSIDNLQIIPEKIEDFTKIEDEKKKLRSALTSPLAQSQSSHIFTFIHTSDTHLKSGNDKQFANILSLLNEDYIDCLIHTGDIVWDNYPYNGDDSAVGLSMFNNLLQSVSKDVIISAGNHDVGGEYKDVNICGTDAQIYNTFYAPLMKNTFVSGGEGKSYFYVDYTQGVRVISLYQYNSDFELDPEDNTKLKDIRGRIAYRQDEIDWLCGVLNSTPEGYAVLLLTHQPESLGGKTNSWQSRQYVNSSWSTFLSDIVNAYIHREVVNTSIEQTVGVVGTIAANYDFSNAKGDFAGFVNGHTHDDFVGKEYNYDLNVLNKCCDNKLYQSGCSIAHIDNTPSENTINVVSINTQYRTISVFRVGGKYTADGDYRNVITLSY